MKNIVVTELEQVAYVKLHRPEIRNAFNPQMIAEITQLFKSFNSRSDLRAVVLQGEGRVFSAGGDLNWMKEMINYSEADNLKDSENLFNMFAAMSECELPIVGAVHGACYGGGLGLVACCDYVLAETGTQFCFSEVKIGISPAVISSFVLRKVNSGSCRPYMLTAQVFTPEVAFQMGLIHEIVAAGEGHRHLQTIVSQIKECAPGSIRETKKLLNEMSRPSYLEFKKRTADLIAQRRVSAEGQEGLKSFLNKTKPFWSNHSETNSEQGSTGDKK